MILSIRDLDLLVELDGSYHDITATLRSMIGVIGVFAAHRPHLGEMIPDLQV